MPSSLLCGVRRSLLGRAKFTPASLANLVVWLDPSYGLYQETTGASATTPAVAANDPVGTWKSRQGSIYFTAPSDTARPLLKFASGKPYLQFDGTDDVLSASVSGARPYTVGLRAMTRTGNTGRTLTDDGSVQNWLLGAQGDAGAACKYYVGNFIGVGAGSADAWYTATATGSSAPLAQWWFGGVSQGTDAVDTGQWGSVLAIGGRPAAATEYGTVSVAGVAHYARILADNERTQLESYLSGLAS